MSASSGLRLAACARRCSAGQLAAGALLLAIGLLHLAYLKVFPLLPEEAYYWNYAARPALGYLDHPPMVAWLIALAEALFGHGEAVVRLPALACGGVVAVFVWRLARRLVDPAGGLDGGGAVGGAALCVLRGRAADHARRPAGRGLGGGAVLSAPRAGRL
jgi:hypothetical protein